MACSPTEASLKTANDETHFLLAAFAANWVEENLPVNTNSVITEVRDPENAKAFNVQSLNNLSQTIYRGLKQASCYMPNAMMRFMVHDANMRDLYEQINLRIAQTRD